MPAGLLPRFKKGPGRVLIYSGKHGDAGVEWKLLHTWVLQEGGMNFDVSRSVLKVSAHGDEEIQFWFQEWFKYVEGRAWCFTTIPRPASSNFNWPINRARKIRAG